MRVELHEKLQRVHKLQASRVLLTDDNGTPLAIALEIEPGMIQVAHILDGDEFDRLLEESGVTRTTLVTAIRPDRLRKPTR